MHPMLNTAVKAARRAGKVIMRYASQLDRLTSKQGRNDFVSQVDREAEAEIIDVLKRAYPDTPYSRKNRRQGKSEFLWIIDPLDGTTTTCMVTPVCRVHRPASAGSCHPGGGVRSAQK